MAGSRSVAESQGVAAQLAATYPQAFAAMASQPQAINAMAHNVAAFQALAQNAAAMNALVRNASAIQALSQQAAFMALRRIRTSQLPSTAAALPTPSAKRSNALATIGCSHPLTKRVAFFLPSEPAQLPYK